MVPLIKVIFVHTVISFEISDYIYRDFFHKATRRVGGLSNIGLFYLFIFHCKISFPLLYSLYSEILLAYQEKLDKQIQVTYVNPQIIILCISASLFHQLFTALQFIH